MAIVRDVDVAAAIDGDTGREAEPGGDGGLGAVGLHLHHPIIRLSAMYTSPLASTATPVGKFRPVPMLCWLPLAATSSTRLLPASAT